MKRLLLALVLGPIILYAVLWGHPVAFLAILSAVALLCQYEYSEMVACYGIPKPGPLGYVAGLVLLGIPGQELIVLVAVTLLSLALAMSTADLSKGLLRAAALVLGVIYIFGCWRYAIPLRAASPHWLVFALGLNWVGDTAAYYVGRAIGKHKLAPRISPAKSWEGAVASLAASLVFGVLYLGKFVPPVAGWEAVAVAAAGNLAGQVGDLAESAMKRGAGIKDSSALLPGHGGWLDRVDGTLFSLPVVYWCMTLFAKL
jgi:phosphatidate cytidylyltransferase